MRTTIVMIGAVSEVDVEYEQVRDALSRAGGQLVEFDRRGEQLAISVSQVQAVMPT
jgi:hypothetical protein